MERIMMPTKQAKIRTLMMVRRERALRMKVMVSSLGCLPAVQVHPHGTRRAMTPSHAARSGGRQHIETGFEIRLWRAGVMCHGMRGGMYLQGRMGLTLKAGLYRWRVGGPRGETPTGEDTRAMPVEDEA